MEKYEACGKVRMWRWDLSECVSSCFIKLSTGINKAKIPRHQKQERMNKMNLALVVIVVKGWWLTHTEK